MRVGQLTEADIIAAFAPLLPAGKLTLLGPGDDCAEIKAPTGKFLVTTDVLAENQHFRTDWSTAEQIGARAAAQNLADVAAMGAVPTALVVSLVLPEEVELDWVLGLVSGLARVVEPTGAGIVGGDLTRGDRIVIAVTAHGSSAGKPVLRSGARPGDTLAVVGTLGRSAAGYAALEQGAVSPKLQGAEVPYPFTEPVAVYRTPLPPLAAGPLAAGRGATAMMDLSDGLVIDGGRLAAASEVHLNLTLEGLQDDVAALQAAGQALGVDPLQWVLYGGEDHGLLVTFPPFVLVREPFRMIGVVSAARGEKTQVTLEGTPLDGGFDHFADSRTEAEGNKKLEGRFDPRANEN